MLAYGGNGPVFAAIQSEELGIDKVLVPKASPNFSALGTLVANPSIDEERSYVARADRLDVAKLKSLWKELGARAEQYYADAGFSADRVKANYQVNMRYAGQNWPLTFDIQNNQGARGSRFRRRGHRDEGDGGVQHTPPGGIRPCARR